MASSSSSSSSSSSRYEVEVKLESARGLKNVNWRHGKNRPYGVVWVDPKYKFTTKVDENGDVEAEWENETLVIPLPPEQPLEDLTLNIDVVHAKEEQEEDTKPLIGSARLKLAEVLDERSASRTLTLKRPSGRPQGKVDVNVTIREPGYRAPSGYNAYTYSVPPPADSSRDYYSSAPGYGYTYGTPQDYGYYSAAATPAGYPYNATPQTASYGQGNYPSQTVSYGQGSNYGYGQESVGEGKKSKFGGMGTGLAVGAVAGVLGGIALAEGAEYVEDKIAEDAAEKVEDDLGYDDGDCGYDGDDL